MTHWNSTTATYNSLTHFELTSSIFDISISPTTIVDAVIKSSNDKIFRSMIYDGIWEYYDDTNDFTFIQSIHDKLMLKKKCSNTQTPSNTSNYKHEFFSVDDLICKTMQYLDFDSLISCRLINKPFLYLSYNISSTRYLDICNLFNIDNTHNVNELLRFKQISKIELAPWEAELNDMLNHLLTFTKLSSIIIKDCDNSDVDPFIQLCIKMIQNNKDNITSMILTRWSGACRKSHIPIEMVNTVTECKYLQQLEISNVHLVSINGDTAKYKNCNNKLVNLKQLVLDNIIIDLSLFDSLLHLNMSKLERLILDDVEITVDSKTIENNVKIDIDPNFMNIKHLTLGKSNGDWHNTLLNNFNKKTKKLQSGSKLESMELSVRQISKKNTAQKSKNIGSDLNIDCHSWSGIRFNTIKKLVINLLKERNVENSIYEALACVGYLTKIKRSDMSISVSKNDDNEFFTYTSDIETLGIKFDEYSQCHGVRFGIVDSFDILNKIEFTNLKSLTFYIKRIFNQYFLKFEPDYFDDLLQCMNTIDKFFDNNQFECINIKQEDDDDQNETLCVCEVSFGTIETCDHKQASEVDDILNKKIKWDQVAHIVSKWCNYNNMYDPNSDKIDENDDGLQLTFQLQFRAFVNLGNDVKISGNTLCQKMKWINTMINALCMCQNTIDLGDMITKNICLRSRLPVYGYDTSSEFDVQLNNCIAINGTINEHNQYCLLEMRIIINLL